MEGDLDPSVVNYHNDGEWVAKDTSGEVPEDAICAIGAGFQDSLVVFKAAIADMEYSNQVYALDLNTWIWTKLSPRGMRPNCRIADIKPVVYKKRVYFFGGYEHLPLCSNSLQVFCYNISTISWEWPDHQGHIPSERSGHSVVLIGDTVLLFGGETYSDGLGSKSQHLNDFYMLDMLNMIWSLVKTGNGKVPAPRSGHTLTPISQSAAVLVGGKDKLMGGLDDCWHIDIDKTGPNKELKLTWTQMSHIKYSGLWLHQAVLEPISQRLWIIGGVTVNFQQPIFSIDVLGLQKISLNVVPLQALAMECAARNISEDDQRLLPDNFPEKLRRAVEGYRSNRARSVGPVTYPSNK